MLRRLSGSLSSSTSTMPSAGVETVRPLIS
jgi:hypothetical protein